MSSKVFEIYDLFLTFLKKRKILIVFLLTVFTTIPVGFAVWIGTETTIQAILFVRRWLLTIIFPFVLLLLPMITITMFFLDLVNSEAIKDLLILPVSREKVFLVGFTFHILLNFVLGLFLGCLLYISINTATLLSTSSLILPIRSILAMGVVTAVFSIIYGSSYLILGLLFHPHSSIGSFIVFFLLTYVWDVIFWGIGGFFAVLSYNFYKLILFNFLLPYSIFKLQFVAILPFEANLVGYSLVLVCSSFILSFFALLIFKRKSF